MWTRVVVLLAVCTGCVSSTAKPVREGLYVVNISGSQLVTPRQMHEEADKRAAAQCPQGYNIRDRFEAKNGERLVMTIECNTSGKVTSAPKHP